MSLFLISLCCLKLIWEPEVRRKSIQRSFEIARDDLHLHCRWRQNLLVWNVLNGIPQNYEIFFADGGGNEAGKRARGLAGMEQNITMEIAQLLLSLLHAWGIDIDLDKVCEGKLGLLRPMLPVSFGVLSKGGQFQTTETRVRNQS